MCLRKDIRVGLADNGTKLAARLKADGKWLVLPENREGVWSFWHDITLSDAEWLVSMFKGNGDAWSKWMARNAHRLEAGNLDRGSPIVKVTLNCKWNTTVTESGRKGLGPLVWLPGMSWKNLHESLLKEWGNKK